MKIVSIDEMEQCLIDARHEHPLMNDDDDRMMKRWERARQLAECACEVYGRLVADIFGLEFNDASLEVGFGGLCCTLAVKTTDQELHPALDVLDPGGEWETLDGEPHEE